MSEVVARNQASAPRDGRVYQGYFLRADGETVMVRVRWHPTRGWVDLAGADVDVEWRLSAWAPD